MDLLYLWTKKFKNIAEQGFSFSDKYIIHYDSRKMELHIKDNDRYIPHFFSGNVTSVTGIIGANGAGKSNLFELLKYTLGSFEEGLSAVYKELVSVVIFEKEIFYHKDLKIANMVELKNLGFSIFSYRDSLAMYYDDAGVRQNIEMGLGNLYTNGHIYYSNIFDGRSDHYHRPTIDISTNNLIWEDKSNQRRSKDRYSIDKNEMDSVVAFQIEETERQIDFLATTSFELPIRVPSSVMLRLEEDYNRFISIYRNWFEDHGLSAYREVDRPRFPPEKEVEQTILKPLLVSAFIYKLLIVFQFNDPEFYKDMTVRQFHTIIYERDFSVLNQLYSPEMLENITGTVRLFEQLIQVGTVYKRDRDALTLFELYDSFGLNLSQENLNFLLDFHRHYYRAVQGHSFLVFYWEGLSSGEYTLLSLYARFNWAFKSYFVLDKKQLIIMIDEGELSLHPSWQASLLYNLMLYFNQRMPDYLIQIIATSHSPFLVSDLPKSMINFLDKDAEGNCLVVDGLNLQKQTFGANIHTLYADAFFMNNTLMGKFAKTKLDRLIGVINRDRDFDQEFPDWNTVRKTVDLIGEPILRGLLLRQLAAVVAIDSDDLEDLKQQMQVLNERIQRIEGGGEMIPINIRDSNKLAAAHAEHIIRYYQGYNRGTPLMEIETWIKTNLDKSLSFKKLLAANEETLNQIAGKYKRKRSKPAFSAGITGIQSQYERFRTVSTSPFSTEIGSPYDGYVFAANLGLSVCPYCNRNYIFNIPETPRTTCELDHFHDKAAFPFLALSFYNLIPSCKTCNHLKSNASGKFYNLHRSDRTETELLRFSCKINGAGFLDDTQDLELKYRVDKLYQATFNQLRIKELYSKHLDLVQEVIKKRLIYNSGYIDQLYRDYRGTLFNSREQVLNHLLSSYIQEDEIHLRPFAKMIRHIWDQLEYIDN